MTKQKYSAYALLAVVFLVTGIFFSGFFSEVCFASPTQEEMEYAKKNKLLTTEQIIHVTGNIGLYAFIPKETGYYYVRFYDHTTGMVTLYDMNKWSSAEQTFGEDSYFFLIKDFPYYITADVEAGYDFKFNISMTMGFDEFVSGSETWNIGTTSEKTITTQPKQLNYINHSVAVKITTSNTAKGVLTVVVKDTQTTIQPLLLKADGSSLNVGAITLNKGYITEEFEAGKTYYLIPTKLADNSETIILTATGTVIVKENPLSVKARTASVSYKKLKKKAQTLDITKLVTFKKKGQGNMKYSLVSAKKGSKSFKKYFKINTKTGKVTVKKKLKKGTYKVKIKLKAAGNSYYKASAWKTVTCTIKVK